MKKHMKSNENHIKAITFRVKMLKHLRCELNINSKSLGKMA